MNDIVDELRRGADAEDADVPAGFSGSGAGDVMRRAAAEIERLRVALKCERASGTCVMVHDPEREPCTVENCNSMRDAVQQIRKGP